MANRRLTLTLYSTFKITYLRTLHAGFNKVVRQRFKCYKYYLGFLASIVLFKTVKEFKKSVNI